MKQTKTFREEFDYLKEEDLFDVLCFLEDNYLLSSKGGDLKEDFYENYIKVVYNEKDKVKEALKEIIKELAKDPNLLDDIM